MMIQAELQHTLI